MGFILVAAVVHAVVLALFLSACDVAPILFLFVLFAVVGVCETVLLRYSGPSTSSSRMSKPRQCRSWRISPAAGTEACFVVASMSVVLLLLAPSIDQARAAARRAQCHNVLVQHSSSHLPVMYRGKLQTCPVCTDKLWDGSPRPILFKYDVAWHESWGDRPDSDSSAYHVWFNSAADADGYYRGQAYVSPSKSRSGGNFEFVQRPIGAVQSTVVEAAFLWDAR